MTTDEPAAQDLMAALRRSLDEAAERRSLDEAAERRAAIESRFEAYLQAHPIEPDEDEES